MNKKDDYNYLVGSVESTHYQYKSNYIQYVFLLVMCIIIIALIIRSIYLDESEKSNTSELIILAVSCVLLLYKMYTYFF